MTGAHYLAIANPAAGGGRCGRECEAAVESLRAAGLDVELAQTTAPGQATELARAAYCAGTRHFIALGGDGTSYEIVNGLFPSPAADAPTLGFMPLGTGNSFLRDFSTAGEAFARTAIVEGRTRPCDVVRLRHRDGVLHYINLLSIGFVADVNGRRARKYSGWGELGYVAAVLREIVSLKSRPFSLSVDGDAFDHDPMVFASFNNSRFTGGKMMMAPDADTSDGLIDFVRVAPLSRLDLLTTFPKIFKGLHVRNPAVAVRKSQTIEFRIDEPIDVMVDGEALTLVPERLDVIPSAIRVHV